MGGKKGGEAREGSKKAAGQARKADAAAAKAAAEDAKRAAAQDSEWQMGAKNSAKKEAEAAKKAEQARKKAEKEALLAEDDQNTPGRALPKKSKTADKKPKPKPSPSGGLDSALSQLELGDNKLKDVSVSGVDNILGAWDAGLIDAPTSIKLEQHPERRKKAAFTVFQERRLKEMKEEGLNRVLRLSQMKKRIEEEFEKSPENPMRQAHISHNATREEKQAVLQAEKEKLEALYTEK
ncbi:DUF1014-domain-containing protein [Xylariaceae sp. AK1471]|nr:DUF1014-domain-containing protein [Xylariaceae sp. AK1471]